MLEVYKKLVAELAAGKPAVMGTIIRQSGSSPRSLGSKFLVAADGTLTGSIGGGLLEASVVAEAGRLCGRETGKIMEIRMTGQEVAGTDMICGGEVDVLIQSFTPDSPRLREVLEAVIRLLEKGGQGILAMGPLPASGAEAPLDLLLYLVDGQFVGQANGPMRETAAADSARILSTNRAELTALGDRPDTLFLEPVRSSPKVIIFGGGHISVKLAPLLTMTGFRVFVVDDREEFASPERFPEAEETLAAGFEQCFERLGFTPETYSVIVTRGHLHDKTVLEQVLARPFRYVGMIGSRRKRNMIYDALLKAGVSPELIRKVNSPIGLDIGAETPEEIALSIAAELVRTRAEGLRMVKDWRV